MILSSREVVLMSLMVEAGTIPLLQVVGQIKSSVVQEMMSLMQKVAMTSSLAMKALTSFKVERAKIR